MIATLDVKRRLSILVTLPPAKPGDQFDATFDAEEDTVILRRATAQPGTSEEPQAVNWLIDADVLSQPANGDARVVAWLEVESD